jgi:hypothetical protein
VPGIGLAAVLLSFHGQESTGLSFLSIFAAITAMGFAFNRSASELMTPDR